MRATKVTIRLCGRPNLKGERYAAVQKWFPEQFACSDFILNGQRRNNRHADPGPDRALNRLDVGQFKSLSDLSAAH